MILTHVIGGETRTRVVQRKEKFLSAEEFREGTKEGRWHVNQFQQCGLNFYITTKICPPLLPYLWLDDNASFAVMCECVTNLLPMKCEKWHSPLPGLDLKRVDLSYSLLPLSPAGTWMRWVSTDTQMRTTLRDGRAITC